MSTFGHLRNTSGNLVIDSVLCLAILPTFAPCGICSPLDTTLTAGVVSSHILSNVIFNNAQVAHSLLMAAYTYPNEHDPILPRIVDRRLTGLAALGSAMGFIQVLLLWACSLTSLVLSVLSGHRGGSLSWLAVFHAVFILLPIAKHTLPKPPGDHNIGTDIVVLILATLNMVIAPTCLLLLLHKEWQHQTGPTNGVAVGISVLRPVTMAALSFRWLPRIGPLGRLALPGGFQEFYREFLVFCVDLCGAYAWGMLPFNYAVYVAGSMFIFLSSLSTGRSG